MTNLRTVAVPPPTDAKATLFVYPDQTVSLDISFVPPALKRAPVNSGSTSDVSVENITIVVTSANEPTSSEHFTEANQTAGMMRVRSPPVFKLAETYNLVMYTNDVVEDSSETRIIMPNFDPRNVAFARIISTSATTIHFHWGDPIFPIDGLKAFQLRGTSSSGEATVEVDSSKRRGHLSNLKPFTNYSTSVVSLYSPDGSANATTNTGVVLTCSAGPTEPTNVTVAAVNSTAVQINWTAPEYSNGELEKYRVLVFSSVVGIKSRFIDMEPNVYSFVFNGLPPSAKIHLAVQAFTKTMKNGFGGGLGKTSPIMLVTSKKDELRGADSDLVVRSVETVKPYARFQERPNVSPDHQVLVAAVPFTQGEQPNLTHQVQATKTLQKEGFPPAAIAITVCGILSLLALVVGITILVVRRRRTRDLNFNVNLENDDANNNEEDKSDPKNSSDF
ncbi:unnamed protein product [Schistocephalus solidus]|uniref:Protein-tyrosine-phosphatase n=1 Tax=Schistocephalus solidus TaxID=70667 RepID=A0A183SP26_SCHSO|nr:unnamed protein product [Schistocephalus solidus]